MKKNRIILFAMFLLLGSKISAQSMLDVSVGSSHQDHFFTNAAYRYTISDRFRIGIEAQFGSTKYRMIEAKPIVNGSATTIGVPLTLRVSQKDKLRIDLYAKPGIRLHASPAADKNNILDSAKKSTAFSFDGGLVITAKLSDKLNFQSGVTFPLFFQVSPSPIFENIYPGLLHFGANYAATEKFTIFAKTAFGAALGGSGDTQKFGWSIQTGLRYALGQKPENNFVEPSF
jgi:hypothetical protein